MTPFEPATIPGQSRLPENLRDHACFLNDVYQVNVRFVTNPDVGHLMHLSIKRRDKQAIHDWRDLQWIKNQIAGPEVEAVEIYPAESRLIDTSNQYHLWCFLGGRKLPFGFEDGRMVSETPLSLIAGQASVQRPFADHCRPDDLAEHEARFADQVRILQARMTT